MLKHQNNKFIYNNAAAIKIPNNVYLDPNPDPCPVEGMVLYSEDLRARVIVDFVETEKDASTFFLEECKGYDNYQCIKPLSAIRTNGADGFTIVYSLDCIYEEYAFSLHGDKPQLLNICIEQKKWATADPTQYAQLVAELLEGIEIL